MYVIIIIERERKGDFKMKILKTTEFGTMRIRENNGCGDVLLGTEKVNGIEYEIYLGYLGYPQNYAVAKGE